MDEGEAEHDFLTAVRGGRTQRRELFSIASVNYRSVACLWSSRSGPAVGSTAVERQQLVDETLVSAL